MKKKQIRILLLLPFLVLLYYFLGPSLLGKKAHISYLIDSNKSIYLLPSTLEKKGIINSAYLLKLFLRMSKIDKKIALGYYSFSSSESLFQIILKLKNARLEQVSITIIEGYDIYDIANTLAKKKIIKNPKIFIREMHSRKWLSYIKKKFHIKTFSLEGFLYPDTYRIPKGASYKLFVDLAIKGFEKRIYKKYKDISPPNFYKTMRIASLIQKETVSESERPLVSSVIQNRLKIGMKLQIDPTIIYSIKRLHLVKQNLKDNRINITKSSFSIPSPFNTYYTKRIPPTPISSITTSSFNAALYPKKTKYLYFVANPETGKHTFTSNLKDHMKYVRLYTHKKYLMRHSK